MQVGNLVRVHSDPLEGPEFRIPSWYLCVIKEIAGMNVIVQTPSGERLTFNISDVETIDS